MMFSDCLKFCARSVLWLLPLTVGGAVSAQAPLFSDVIAERELGDKIDLEWRVSAAERALEAGLASLADSIYRGLLELEGRLSAADSASLKLGLAKALIAQRRYVAARSQLESIGDDYRGGRHSLYLALSIYGEGGRRMDVDSFRQVMGSVSASGLPPGDLPWLALLRGLEAELKEDAEAAQAAFEEAAGLAETDALRWHFESLALRQEMLSGTADELMVPELRARLSALEGEAAAFPFAREYAVLLYQLGRVADAVGVIDRQLADTGADYNSRQREQLRLLKALIMGADSVTGRAALKELIQDGESRDVMGIALQLLARTPGMDDDFFEFLNVMISQTERHPLVGQMYYFRSQLALEFPDDPEMVALAERDAQTLLEQFPGLSSITKVYRLLAYAALNREPPQYRTAADFLTQLRDQASEPGDLVYLNRLIGDCYFMNGDFANAVDFYTVARNRQLATGQAANLFMRLVLAQVRSGALDAATELIDEADFTGEISQRDRWRAEWNVAQALQADGSMESALRRVRLLLERSSSAMAEDPLNIRLRWLEAHLSLEAGQTTGLEERINQLLARLDALPEDTLEDAELRLLLTEIRLLRGNALMRLGNVDEGIAQLKALREEFGEAAAAQRSYLIEAAHHGEVGAFASAQNTLSQLVERHPDSPLAPQALYEAALYCERRGVELYPEAIVLYNNLAEQYPEDPLDYHARLKQGNLLRTMNDFAGAQIVYENLINQYPTHRLRYLAELSRADCLLALAGNEPGPLAETAAQLERLLDLPNLPRDFQAEVSHKWAFALSKAGSDARAKEVLSLSVSRLLLDPDSAVTLGGAGRYWIARSLLRLGEILEGDASAEAAKGVYQKIIDYNLPGGTLARVRLDRLRAID